MKKRLTEKNLLTERLREKEPGNGGNKNIGKPDITDSKQKMYRIYMFTVLIAALPFILSVTTAYATGGGVPPGADPVQVVSKLSDFIFVLIKSIGMIMLGFGIVQVGLSLKSHDASQRANGFLTLLGGVIIAFTKEILTLITS